ncbi:MAG: xanthine dehydrogenase accessory protein XdhC [Alphaproteobacteria bacterium]|nr:xanthine dehydrogenase accessory protein XdhC [Alphaproteobacteria bacterium]
MRNHAQKRALGDWRQALAAVRGTPHVLVTIVTVDGSAPREAGAKMVVTPDDFAGSIGGGNLEFQALQMARAMLTDGAKEPTLKPFPLGPALGQCCGGAVEILFEPFADDRIKVVLFGAGHVGRALVDVLATLPADVTWIDGRPDIFPTNLPACVTAIEDDDPAALVADAPPGACFLVMTHAHDLDEEITGAILARGDFAYCGLIGSGTKAARFRTRFKQRGLHDAQIARLTSPIGIDGIHGKTPPEIAVSVAAQLLQLAGTKGPTDRNAICGEVTKGEVARGKVARGKFEGAKSSS